MIRSVPSPSPTPAIFAAADRRQRGGAAVCCSVRRSSASIPRLEPFSRDKIARGVKEASLLHKSENDIADYCSTLEGDESYNCWRAYFVLKELEREVPKDEVENIIRQTDGVKSLIGCLHGIATARKMVGKKLEMPKTSDLDKQQRKPFPIPDGIPKTLEELEEEEEEEAARMPDSAFTRLLRSKGKFPAWYSPVPDHETD